MRATIPLYHIMWLFTFLSDYCIINWTKTNYYNIEKIFYLVSFKFLCGISTTGYSKKNHVLWVQQVVLTILLFIL